MSQSAVALLYHDVYDGDDPRTSGFQRGGSDAYKLTVSAFEAHLEAIEARRRGPVLGPEFPATTPSEPGGTPTLLTFDDGGVSAHTLIAPRLEARGWRGFFFITTDRIGEDGFLDAERIADLDRRGHVIGTHSCSHPPRISACTADELAHEWGASRRRLAEIVGHDIDVGSVPGGYVSDAVARAAGEAGVTTLFTSDPVRHARRVDDCVLYGRYPIKAGTPAPLAGAFVAEDDWRLRRALLWWRAKGVAKSCLGPAYPWLRDRIYGRA